MKVKIFNKGFNALLVTQFLGAGNDNILKQILALQVVSGIWADQLGRGGQGLVTVIFTMPFLLCSGWAGQLADRFSKQKMTQWVKIAEILIAIAALIALWNKSLWTGVAMLLFISLQSAVFGPAKYGMIPEIFPEEALSRANAAINMLTNVAVILGLLIGGVLSEAYPEHDILPGLALVVIACVGYLSSLFLLPLPARDPKLRLSGNPFKPYLFSLKIMIQNKTLILVAIASAFMNMIAIILLQAILDLGILLNLGDRQTSFLNVPLIIGIGAGSVLAGALSKDRIRLVLVPIGAGGIIAVLGVLGLAPLTHMLVLVNLAVLGVFGGLYLVPLQALLQARSPQELRGRIMGTSGFLSFAFISIGGGIYWMLRALVNIEVQSLLLLSSIMTLLFSAYVLSGLRKFFAKRLAK